MNEHCQHDTTKPNHTMAIYDCKRKVDFGWCVMCDYQMTEEELQAIRTRPDVPDGS